MDAAQLALAVNVKTKNEKTAEQNNGEKMRRIFTIIFMIN